MERRGNVAQTKRTATIHVGNGEITEQSQRQNQPNYRKGKLIIENERKERKKFRPELSSTTLPDTPKGDSRGPFVS